MLLNLLFHHIEHLESLRERHACQLNSRVVYTYVLRPPAGIAVFFSLRDTDELNTFSRLCESCGVEIALINASSSCLNMTLRQEHS